MLANARTHYGRLSARHMYLSLQQITLESISSLNMSTSTDDPHESLSQQELKYWHRAKIVDVRQMTLSVTGLSLLVETENPEEFVDHNFRRVSPQTQQSSPCFSFFPGQWVDFYIPQLKKIGGYSLTSLPSALPRIELAVKASCHPPAQWVTEHASVGDEVKVRVGGDFVYNKVYETQSNAKATPIKSKVSPEQEVNNESPYNLFIAGGVGINPLFGMISQIHEDLTNNLRGSKAALLYSASCEEELLFDAEFKEMLPEFPKNFSVRYFLTKRSIEENRRQARINKESIAIALSWLGCESKEISVYICGPEGMAEDVSKLCAAHGVSPDSIHFEQWW
mmetsp:Transcript_49846/g.149894  ORF Transcript_49846/g.149894 Transcript_49846/m.149894 type:complete len:337 (-) Transcript_49846:131-1141(-)